MKVKDLFNKHSKNLLLQLIAGADGLQRDILKDEVHRPGLALSGFFKHFSFDHILVFGQTEIEYLKTLEPKVRESRLAELLLKDTPAVILANGEKPDHELMKICALRRIPLFNTALTTRSLINKLFFLLHEEFAPTETLHGTLVEVFGIGVIIQGDSSIGKSEAALGLLEKGHRLISDDAVTVKKQLSKLIGSGPVLTRHMMEIRGIGIINAAQLHGAICIRHNIEIELVVRLEEWNEDNFYDRIGLEEKFFDILEMQVPLHILPAKTGRDIVLLIETVALNHRLKVLGYHSAKEFNAKLVEAIKNQTTLSKRNGCFDMKNDKNKRSKREKNSEACQKY